MEYLGVLVPSVLSLVAVAVSWGHSQAKIEELRRENTEIRVAMKDFHIQMKDLPTKEGCTLKHQYLNEVVQEIRNQLKEVLAAIKELGKRGDE